MITNPEKVKFVETEENGSAALPAERNGER